MPEDCETTLMDYHVMVEPTEADQILGFGSAPSAPRDDVMGFDWISRVATVAGTSVAVTVRGASFQSRRNDALFAAVLHETSIFGPHRDLGDGVAKDRFESGGPDLRPALEGHAGPSVCSGRAGVRRKR